MGDDDEGVWLDELIEAMGGEGEFVDRARVCDLWRKFSLDFGSSWLMHTPLMMGNFAAWLIGRGVPSATPGKVDG